MYEFSYVRPENLAQALNEIKQEDASYLAGGHTLIPTLKQRLNRVSKLIDLGSITELKGISVSKDGAKIGSMTSHGAVVESSDLAKTIPILPELAEHIGDPQVRNRGTIGGSIANHDPNADWPVAVLGLNATVVTNKRSIKADDFFTGLYETALEEGELVTRIDFPIPEVVAYSRFDHPSSRYALVGVLVAKVSGEIRVAVTGAGQEGVFRVAAFETALKSSFTPAAVEAVRLPDDLMNEDMHGSQSYRSHLVTVMASRAVARLVS